MSGEVPAMFWYLFWVGVLVFMIAFGGGMTLLVSRRNMKALALLKLYAEKGVDPPATLAELLASGAPCASDRRAGGRR